jgi:large subunit ribosomal protein L18e
MKGSLTPRFVATEKNRKLTKRRIWRRIIEELNRKGKLVEVNLFKLNKVASTKGSIVVVPGKVLGSGDIEKQLTVGAFSFSKSASQKIVRSGGKVMTIDEFMASYPTGRGVVIVGNY